MFSNSLMFFPFLMTAAAMLLPAAIMGLAGDAKTLRRQLLDERIFIGALFLCLAAPAWAMHVAPFFSTAAALTVVAALVCWTYVQAFEHGEIATQEPAQAGFACTVLAVIAVLSTWVCYAYYWLLKTLLGVSYYGAVDWMG